MNRNRMATDLQFAGIELDSKSIDRLWRFHQILRHKNQDLNLTRLYNFDTMVRKHYVDCLLVAQLLAKHKIEIVSGPIMDLGSGGGFPGIPISILWPNTPVYLVEGRENRCAYLQETVAELGLHQVSVYWSKLNSKVSIGVNTVITRAVESMTDTVGRISASLAENGYLIFMKGPNCDQEIELMKTGHCQTEYNFIADIHYKLPDESGQSNDRRRLVVFQRQSKPTIGRKIRQYGENSELLKSALEISSADNPKFKSLKRIITGGTRAIQKEGRTLVYGRKVVAEIIDQFSDSIETVILDKKTLNHTERMPQIPETVNVWLVASSLIAELELKGFESPYLLFRIEPIEEWQPALPINQPMVFLPLGDPENLGLALRSAFAFGYTQVVLLEEAASPYLPAVIRASSGASLRLKYFRGPSIHRLADEIQKLDKIDFYGLDRSGVPLHQVPAPKTGFGLIVGEEGQGLPESLKALGGKSQLKLIGIPISEDIDSLNAAVSLSIAFYGLQNRF